MNLPVPPPAQPTTCPHCAGQVELLHHDQVYGRAYGKWPYLYQCSDCEARVGATRGAKNTSRAHGSLATPELSAARQRAHAAFDPLWKSGSMSRTGAYAWLASQLDVPRPHCHIGWFNVAECERVIAVVAAREEAQA